MPVISKRLNPDGIILSGGPESVTEAGSPRAPRVCFRSRRNQFLVSVMAVQNPWRPQLGGAVQGSNLREFGYARVEQIADWKTV